MVGTGSRGIQMVALNAPISTSGGRRYTSGLQEQTEKGARKKSQTSQFLSKTFFAIVAQRTKARAAAAALQDAGFVAPGWLALADGSALE